MTIVAYPVYGYAELGLYGEEAARLGLILDGTSPLVFQALGFDWVVHEITYEGGRPGHLHVLGRRELP